MLQEQKKYLVWNSALNQTERSDWSKPAKSWMTNPWIAQYFTAAQLVHTRMWAIF
jgi:hypothetical protein